MFETPDIQYNWAIWKKKTGKWVNITERPPKPGKSVSFNFGQGAIGEEFRLEVYKAKKKLLSNEWEAKKMGEIFVVPTNSKTPKISKVVLFNRGARDPNKASYQDTLIAQAHCVAMFNQEVEFNLWEDDATGGGHNAEINKNNKAPKIYKARVNEKGIAEAKISLLSDANVLKQIANRYMMRGDHNEGANHEFYVTASYSGKIKGDSKVNVSVANPDHRPKTKPKDDRPKFPVGTSGTIRQPDPEGNIHDAYFINDKGQQLSKVSVGEHVKIRILSKNMIGKRIQYVVWEYDATSNDAVYRSGVIKIIADACDTGGFTISPNIFDRGIDFGSVDSDAKKQNYFIEIISFDTSNTSKKFGVTADGLMTVEKTKSAAVVQNTPAPTTSSTCICKEQYKDLIWGEKVSCEFRKKVVEIANRLGKDPNLLMAGMALETGRTFSPTAGKGTSYVGLIQFGDSAAESVGTTRKELLTMSAIKQLDYVEKYLTKKKDKINTLTDFYLSILMPVDVGKGNQKNHVVFDNEYPLVYKKDGKTLTDLSKSRHYGYRQNPSFLHEDGEKKKYNDGGGKKYNGPGKTYIWEIEKSISNFYEEGKLHKVKIFDCKKAEETTKPSLEKGTWNVVITEKYTGSKCTHIEKTPIRTNCRRGKIEVYDHNKNIVFTIADCLLEGIAGEDRMVTDSDAPFGKYQIASDPFIMGSSSGKKRTAYGPNPRLSFEPIKGSGDEADESGRSLIRIHGGRQETESFEPRKNPYLMRTHGCIRIMDHDAKNFYDWWTEYRKNNPNVKPGKLTLKK